MNLEVYKFQISTAIFPQKGPTLRTEFEASRDIQKRRNGQKEGYFENYWFRTHFVQTVGLSPYTLSFVEFMQKPL